MSIPVYSLVRQPYKAASLSFPELLDTVREHNFLCQHIDNSTKRSLASQLYILLNSNVTFKEPLKHPSKDDGKPTLLKCLCSNNVFMDVVVPIATICGANNLSFGNPIEDIVITEFSKRYMDHRRLDEKTIRDALQDADKSAYFGFKISYYRKNNTIQLRPSSFVPISVRNAKRKKMNITAELRTQNRSKRSFNVVCFFGGAFDNKLRKYALDPTQFLRLQEGKDILSLVRDMGRRLNHKLEINRDLSSEFPF
jgi:hypothetical protein